MKTRIESLLRAVPPRIPEAIEELRQSVLLGTYLDARDRLALDLADLIAQQLPSNEDRLRFWEEVERFIDGDLKARFPGIDFGKGHPLFRQALLALRLPGGVERARELLDRARRDDARQGVGGLASAADRWYRLFAEAHADFTAYLDALTEVERNYFFDTVSYGWDSTIASRNPDPRIQHAVTTIAENSKLKDHVAFALLAILRYRELFTAAQSDAVVSGLACIGYLAEWCAHGLLSGTGVHGVAVNQNDRRPLAKVNLLPLVKAVAETDRSQHRIVGSLLWFVWNLRNRVHLGHDLSRDERLEGGLMSVLLHITDRLILETSGVSAALAGKAAAN